MSGLGKLATKHSKRALVALFLGGMFAATAVSLPTRAADETIPAERITVSPADQDFSIKAGQTKQGSMKVINSGRSEYSFIVYPRPYFVKNESYDPSFEVTGTNTDVYQWINLAKTSYTIKAGETLEVPYSITVPRGAKPGGHYGVLFAESQPNNDKNQSVVRKKRVGMVVRVSVAGKITRQGSLESTSAPFWQTARPLKANARIKNSGNDDFSTTSTLTVRDLFGNIKQRIVKESVIYPGTIRRVDLAWEQAPWFGLFKVEIGTKFLSTTDTKTHYVLVMPRWLGLVVLLFAAGAAYGIYRRR